MLLIDLEFGVGDRAAADCIRGTVRVSFDVLRILLLEKRVHFFVYLLHC